MPSKRNAAATGKHTHAKKLKTKANGKQRATTISMIEHEAEEDEAPEQDSQHAQGIDTVASLKGPQLPHTRGGVWHGVQAFCPDPKRSKPCAQCVLSTTRGLDTAWGDRADSMNATLTENKLYEIYNAALAPANNFKTWAPSVRLLTTAFVANRWSRPRAAASRRTEHQCYTADTLNCTTCSKASHSMGTAGQDHVERRTHKITVDRHHQRYPGQPHHPFNLGWRNHAIFGNENDYKSPSSSRPRSCRSRHSRATGRWRPRGQGISPLASAGQTSTRQTSQQRTCVRRRQ